MEIRKWICFGVPLIIGVGMLLASQPKDKKLPPTRRVDFDYDSSWNGIPLTSGQSTSVAAAIESIRTAPPDSISYTNAAGSTITVSCSTLADCLTSQLNSGKIQAESLNTADGGEYGGEINVGEHRLAACSTDTGMTFLEELLIHEETHKGAHQDDQTSDENETEAYGAELAYKDSNGLDSASNGDYRDALSRLKTHQWNYDWTEFKKRIRELLAEASGKITFIDHGDGLDPDFFKSHALTGGDYVYDLSPFLDASDMLMHQNYFLFPPEHSLALICGGDLIVTGHARIVGFDIFDGMVQPYPPPPDPYVLLDFTVPPYDPMYFYSMAHYSQLDRYYLVDSLNQQIVTMGAYGEMIPLMEDLTTYASAVDFEPLMGMRSVEPTVHRWHGFGLIVNHEDQRYTDAINPYDDRWFLPDADGDHVADACIPAMRYEFVTCKPKIDDPPWEGDMMVQLFASWDHPIEVWATDSLGQTMFEFLGSTHMEMPHMECWLARSLMAGEYIIAIDAENGRKLNLATKVIAPAVHGLTISLFDAAAQDYILRWEAVPGANMYYIYESSDPMVFPPWPMYASPTNEMHILAPIGEKLFYQVTAAKEEPMR